MGGYGGTVVETLDLFTPDESNMTHNDPEWLTMTQDDIPWVMGALGGPGGRQGAPGGARGVQDTRGAKKCDKTAK